MTAPTDNFRLTDSGHTWVMPNIPKVPAVVTAVVVEYGFGEYKLTLPKDEEEARKVWVKIKKIVDGLLLPES